MHIPFCKQACNYCNFHFTTSLRYKTPVVAALCAEIALQKNFLNGAPVQTIYFGGGTPSLLSVQELTTVLNTIRQHFSVQPGAEITLEANPDDIGMDILKSWKEAGINRLSIGIQSFFEEELLWMHRAHNSRQARQCIEDSLAAGFDNFSIDLIYGSPLLTDAMWQQNVDIATGYGIPHLSCYALTVEEKTPLHKLIATGKKATVENEQQARQFLLLMQWLQEKGYEHYEISNFAKPGLRSRHNSAYWKGVPYLGIGPSAHSYNGTHRFWNVAHNAQYITAINEGNVPAEKEALTSTQKLNEYLMIALRTREGIDLQQVARAWGFEKVDALQKRAVKYTASYLITDHNNRLQLTNEGMLMADGIAADLFF